MPVYIIAIFICLAIVSVVLAAFSLYLLTRLSRRLILDKDSIITHLNAKIEEAEIIAAEQKATLAGMDNDLAVLRKRMGKYPSLFLKRRVYWPADPDAIEKGTAYCPECWNNNHILSPLDRSKATSPSTVGICEKHSPPLQF